MRPSLSLLAIAALFGLAACDGDSPRGLMIGSDGRVLANNAKTHREETIARIRDAVDKDLGAHWRCLPGLDRDPIWEEGRRESDGGDFRWTELNAAIELLGDGQAALPVPKAEVERAVRAYLAPKMIKAEHLTVTVQETSDAARFAALVGAVPPTVARPAGNPGAPALRSYVVQAGDTLVDLSQAFYGSSTHWKLIRDANPGVSWDSCPVGTSISIPPKPTAAPAP